jgi:hypothetical protein
MVPLLTEHWLLPVNYPAPGNLISHASQIASFPDKQASARGNDHNNAQRRPHTEGAKSLRGSTVLHFRHWRVVRHLRAWRGAKFAHRIKHSFSQADDNPRELDLLSVF